MNGAPMTAFYCPKLELLHQIFCLCVHLTAIQGEAWRCLFLSQLLFPSVITEQQLDINLAFSITATAELSVAHNRAQTYHDTWRNEQERVLHLFSDADKLISHLVSHQETWVQRKKKEVKALHTKTSYIEKDESNWSWKEQFLLCLFPSFSEHNCTKDLICSCGQTKTPRDFL